MLMLDIKIAMLRAEKEDELNSIFDTIQEKYLTNSIQDEEN